MRRSKIFFLHSCVGDERVQSFYKFYLRARSAFLNTRSKGTNRRFLTGNEDDSRNETTHKSAAGAIHSQCPKLLRSIKLPSLFFPLPHSRNFFLFLPTRLFRARVAFGLKVLDLNHRAGFARIERTPRPSFPITMSTLHPSQM